MIHKIQDSFSPTVWLAQSKQEVHRAHMLLGLCSKSCSEPHTGPCQVDQSFQGSCHKESHIYYSQALSHEEVTCLLTVCRKINIVLVEDSHITNYEIIKKLMKNLESCT